ncbi:uncharacterized protein LOC129963204 [Argiope bruennichi]|uniref:uncharacterized protein LOC129963204 n=1 Tax=Argiope bruennichi TaxID=94029 RepID=UPI0024942D8D|nr:uncharacterized protein LOC129963204 [Argiope bruennichi]
MTTVEKMKDAKKAALQDELKYYSGLLAAHYSSVKTNSQNLNIQSTTTRNLANSTCNNFKTTTNNWHLHKSTSFQRNVTKLPNQNIKVRSSFTLHKKMDLRNKIETSNSFSFKKYPCQSSTMKVNSSALSYKSSNHTGKTLEQKNPVNSEKQMKSDVNKSAESSSRVLMDEIHLLLKQLKQKTENVDNKVNHVSSKVHSLNKCILNKPELKAPIKVSTDSKIICNTLSNSQTISSKDKNYNIFSSVDSSLLSSKNSNSGIFNEKKKNSQEKLSRGVNDSSVKPVPEFRNSFQQQSNQEISTKTLNESIQDLRAKFGTVDAYRVINIVKTPVKKKLNSAKKLNGTTLFASKYKVVNEKRPCVQQEKVALVTTEVKTPLKMKPVQKHINSVKKTKGAARLINTKYTIINKKLPCVQSLNSENSFHGNGGDGVCKLSINDKWTGLKTNGIKLKASKLNSKYKIVNKSENPTIGPTSFFENKSINAKEGKLGEFVHERNKKNLSKFSTCSSLRKYKYTASKLHGERKIIKSMTPLKHDSSCVLNLKRKKPNPFTSNSKYRTVNKQPVTSLKKVSETVKSNNSNNEPNSSIDPDLLMELAAECNDNVIADSPNKHILIKRVFKSKNAIVNKNICSLQSKAAKMIKTKYSTLNKKHSWQKQSFTKRLISPKCFKGHKFDSIYQRKMPFYHNQRKRNNIRHKSLPLVSTYFPGRSYSRNYLVSKNRSNAVGSLQSMVKTPKRFVLNRKVHLKTPNSMKSIVPTSKSMASRALNRSINRVLTASVKKKTSKMNIYCMFYNRFGRCNKGIKCPYVHDPSKIAVCTRFLRGTCKTENCPFSHEICPGKMAICSFFLLGSCTKTDCPYRHETLSPNAKLCKAFVQGYCPDGKQCKQAHVLVCPQFVQGHCDKGDACPFPHPPSKEKKTIPNLAEKNENLEETEELILEKMSRYFECAYESPTNNRSGINSIAVPRIRKLPEQPSFIAL